MTVHARICEFCKESFMPAKNGWRRSYCFESECEAKHEEKKQAYFREYRKTYKPDKKVKYKSWKTTNQAKAVKKGRLCEGKKSGCKVIIDNKNKHFCSICHPKMGHNYIIGEAV